MVENSVNRLCSNVSRFCRIAGSGSFTKNFIEEQIHLRPKRRNARQFRRDNADLLPSRSRTLEFLVEFLFGPGFEQFGFTVLGRRVDLRLLQNILDALEAGGERLEIRRGPHVVNRFQRDPQIGQVVRSRRAITAFTSSYAKPRTSRK